MSDKKTKARLESFLSQRSAELRDSGEKVEISTGDLWALVNLAGLGHDVMLGWIAFDRKDSQEMIDQAKARMNCLGQGIAGEDGKVQEGLIMFAAVTGVMLCDRYSEYEVGERGGEETPK